MEMVSAVEYVRPSDTIYWGSMSTEAGISLNFKWTGVVMIVTSATEDKSKYWSYRGSSVL